MLTVFTRTRSSPLQIEVWLFQSEVSGGHMGVGVRGSWQKKKSQQVALCFFVSQHRCVLRWIVILFLTAESFITSEKAFTSYRLAPKTQHHQSKHSQLTPISLAVSGSVIMSRYDCSGC